MSAGKWKQSLGMLFQGKGGTAKRSFVVTVLTITAAKCAEFKLAIVGVFVAVLA